MSATSHQRLVKKIADKTPTTLVSKQWHVVCASSSIAFGLALFLSSEIANRVKDSPSYAEKTCTSLVLSDSEIALKYMIIGASASSCLVQVFHCGVAFFKPTLKNTFSAYMTAFMIMLISFTSEVIMMTGNFDSVCEDPFGVKSPIIQISEWQITVPLMLYLTLTLDTNKKKLTIRDYTILLCGYFGVMCGFLPILLSWQMGVYALIVAACAVPYALIMNVVDAYSSYAKTIAIGMASPSEYVAFTISRRRLETSIYLLIICLFFPATFFSRAFGLVGSNFVFAAFAILNFWSKNLFAMFLMEGHLEVLDPSVYQLLAEKAANATKRAFIRYVFHEVRSPLNSMIMGLHVLLDTDSDFEEHETEAVTMMREATTYMSETLNDVLNMQKIDEGLLEMLFVHVDVKKLVTNVASTYKDIITDKRINFTANLHPTAPTAISGDVTLLELALANFVSNAIKFSPPDSSIDLDVSPFTDAHGVECVHFLVRDQGSGISEEDRKQLFVPYVQLRPGELKAGRGAGVGLAICKEIVDRHGGEVGCRSVMRSEEERLKASLASGGAGIEKGGSEFFFFVPIGELSPEDTATGFRLQITPDVISGGSRMITSVTTAADFRPSRAVVETVPKLPKTTVVPRRPVAVPAPVVATVTTPVVAAAPVTAPVSTSAAATAATVSTSAAATVSTSGDVAATVSTSGDLAAPVATSAAAAAAAPVSGLASKEKFLFLAVDDVLSNRKMLNILLKKKGVDCEMAEDGVQAIKMVEANPDRYDIIFMDNMMPNMNGVETTRNLRKMRFPRIILGLTGNTLADEVLEFENAGADAVFPKPLNIKQVDALLKYIAQAGTGCTIDRRTEALSDGSREVSLNVYLKAAMSTE